MCVLDDVNLSMMILVSKAGDMCVCVCMCWMKDRCKW